MLIVACFGALGPLAGQDSPLQWPIPSSPARPPVFPRLLIGAEELRGLLGKADTIPLDARGDAAYERGHLPGAVLAWTSGGETGSRDRVRSLLAERGITGGETVVLYGGPDRERVDRPRSA